MPPPPTTSTPKIGDVVHYVHETAGTHTPAIVLADAVGQTDALLITILVDPTLARESRVTEDGSAYRAVANVRRNVGYDAAGTVPQSWHWPEHRTKPVDV